MTEQERSEKYNCDGRCYGTGMCYRAGTCPETKRGEFLATLAAIVIMLFIPVISFIAIILMIVRCLYG